MTWINLWNTIIVPVLWLLALLGLVVVWIAIIKLFNWLMDKLSNLD